MPFLDFRSRFRAAARAAGAVRPAAALVLLLPLGACSEKSTRAPTHAGRTEESSNGALARVVIGAPSSRYTVARLDSMGSIEGRITMTEAPAADSSASPDSSCSGADSSLIVSRGRIANAVVWLTDLRSGKPAVPTSIHPIVHERCAISPRVQAVAIGGALNVHNEATGKHQLRVNKEPTGDAVMTLPFYDEGAVVPTDRLVAKSGLIELVCRQHPSVHGWVAAFDHPYFAVTSADGSFTLDSIPPGTYHVRVWHERLGLMEDTVHVASGRATSVSLAFP